MKKSFYERTAHKRKVTLFSYPRSGSNWVAYCIEKISGLVVIGSDGHIGDIAVENRLEIDPKALVHKSHGGKMVLDWFTSNTTQEGLLLVIRNYKEAILRDAGNKPKYPAFHPINDMKPSLQGIDNPTDSPDYLSMIQNYDSYNGPKLLIDYDNFILNIENELKKLGEWLVQFGGAYNEIILNKFMEDIEHHKKFSMSRYKNMHGKTATDGNPKKLKIQKETWLTDKTEREIDEYVEKQDKIIYEKYLKKYKL